VRTRKWAFLAFFGGHSLRQLHDFVLPNYDLLRWRQRASAASDAKNLGRRRDAAMAGSIVLARTVGDKQLSDTLLEAGRQSFAPSSFAPSSRGRQRGSASSGQKLNSTGAVSVRQSVIANVER
jgi:hypothetical protein